MGERYAFALAIDESIFFAYCVVIVDAVVAACASSESRVAFCDMDSIVEYSGGGVTSCGRSAMRVRESRKVWSEGAVVTSGLVKIKSSGWVSILTCESR